MNKTVEVIKTETLNGNNEKVVIKLVLKENSEYVVCVAMDDKGYEFGNEEVVCKGKTLDNEFMSKKYFDSVVSRWAKVIRPMFQLQG